MSRVTTDEEHKEFISGFYGLIEQAIKTARSHMGGGAGCRPEIT